MEKNVVKVLVLIEGILILSYYVMLRFSEIKIDYRELWLIIGSLVVVCGLFAHISHELIACNIILVSTCLVIILISFICYMGKSEYDGNENVIIVLASGFDESGDLSPNTKMRLDKSIEYNDTENIYIVSGGQIGRGKTEAAVMKEYLIEKGIDEYRIQEENESSDTYESLRNCKKYINDKKVLIVSSRFHLCRCKMLSQALGYKECTFLATDSISIMKPYYYVREIGALLRELLIKHVSFSNMATNYE